jgi:ferredoxin/flavodoxin
MTPPYDGAGLYYFSGTGNTLLAARAMADEFRGRGIGCRLGRIESSDPAKTDARRALGLAFPIAAFTTYPLVWDFIERLPRSEGAPAFALATMAGMSLCAMGPLKAILEKKGYLPIGARQLVMPSNLWVRKYNTVKTREKVRKALLKARGFANDILEGRSKWRRFPLVPGLLSPVFRSRWVWNSTPGYVKLDRDKCTNCALCLELCPAGAVQLNSDVRITDKRQFCMRCVSYCPQQALYYGKDRHQRYRPVEAAELISNYQ